MHNVIGPKTKHRLLVAEHILIWVVAPSIALGFWFGTQATAQAQAHTDQAIKAAVAAQPPAPSKN